LLLTAVLFIRRAFVYSIIKIRLKAAKENSFVAITYTTKDNYPSANNLISCGFKFYFPEYAYGGDEMLYFHKDLN